MTTNRISGSTSDGYHTFDELYAHRCALTAALVRALGPAMCWRSKAHHPDGDPIFDGYFIVGVDLPNGRITYHYSNKHWDEFPHARTLDHAPEWDGATPDDSVSRLLTWAGTEVPVP